MKTYYIQYKSGEREICFSTLGDRQFIQEHLDSVRHSSVEAILTDRSTQKWVIFNIRTA